MRYRKFPVAGLPKKSFLFWFRMLCRTSQRKRLDGLRWLCGLWGWGGGVDTANPSPREVPEDAFASVEAFGHTDRTAAVNAVLILMIGRARHALGVAEERIRAQRRSLIEEVGHAVQAVGP